LVEYRLVLVEHCWTCHLEKVGSMAFPMQ